MKKRITAPRQVLEELQADYSICTKCKICQGVHVQFCADSRFWRNCPSGTRYRWEAYYASGKMELARGLHTKELAPNEVMRDILYACNLCSSCQEQCYEVKQLLPTRVFELMREKAVAEGWGPMPEHKKLAESLEKNDNPWDLPKKKRGDWAKGLPLKNLNKEKADVLFFAGCTYAADPALLKPVRAAALALVEGGWDAGTLGAEELCCGAPMLLVGDRDYFETYAFENIERFNALGVKTIVAPCSHCAWVFKEEYADHLNADIKVMQVSEALWWLLKKDKSLNFTQEVKMKAVWHDPCKLGRRFDQYKKPRAVLEAIPGLELLEFHRSMFNSLCCGGGGGVPYAFPDFALYTAKERLFEAESVGAEAIVTSCPYCLQMFRKAVEAKKSDMKVYDLAEIVMMALGKEV
jgi:Fe-S oxidoreductase